MRVLGGSYDDWVPPEGGAAVAVGVYNGVHLGHQHVLAALRQRAEDLGGLPLAVLTFDRHPMAVVDPDRVPRALTSPAHKLELLEAVGVDVTAVLTFDDETRKLGPEDFAADVLVGALGASVVAVGSGFRFGRGRSGDVEELRTLGLGLGFSVEEVDLVGAATPVSSTRIREAVATGDVGAAAAALGRPFELRGTVVRGEGRGAGIGFPTANLDLDPGLLVPAHGVYAVWVEFPEGGATVAGVVNVGVRPTFDGPREVVEVHLLDYDADLYGRELHVQLVERLRGEQKFDGIDALVAQIGRDVKAARVTLERS